MENTEIMEQTTQQEVASLDRATRMIAQVAQAMQGMADMMRATNERMAALEQQVRLLTKVTTMQAGEISAAIRARAAELCEQYKVPNSSKAVANAIRRDVRLMQGVQNMREIARCEYAVVMQQVKIWDDYKVMKGMKERGKQIEMEVPKL